MNRLPIKLTYLLIFEIALILNTFLPSFSFDSEFSVIPSGSASVFAQTIDDESDSSVLPEAGINLTLSPTFVNLVTEPGKSVKSQMKITNNSSFVENLSIEVAKFEAAEGGARPLINDMTDQDDYQDWVVFDESTFSVQPGESKTVNFTITPTEDASLGYYYAFVVNRQGQQTVEQGASVSGSPALLALLEVPTPNMKRELQLVEFTTDSMFYEYLPTTFNVKIKNSGNIHVVPVGDIIIDSMSASNIGAVRMNEGQSNVLPQTEREFNVMWDDGFAVHVPKKDENGTVLKDAKGQIQYETKYDFEKGDKFRFGKYTATLIMAYNNGERDIPVEATVSFWVIPWKIVGAVLLVVIFALLGLKNTILPLFSKFSSKKK